MNINLSFCNVVMLTFTCSTCNTFSHLLLPRHDALAGCQTEKTGTSAIENGR